MAGVKRQKTGDGSIELGEAAKHARSSKSSAIAN